MKTMKESLVEEIIQNARSDRKRLEAVAKGLTTGFSNAAEDSLDEDVSAAFAEEIAKISDSLTKINQQLVELVKIDVKKNDKNEKQAQLSQEEKDSLYDEVMEKELN